MPPQSKIWTCPLCKNKLLEDNRAYRCISNHSFDTAKQGYVNLVLANKKNSKEPGDSADMIYARSAFLTSGHYDFLVKCLASHFQGIAKAESLIRIADIGCGEGFYIRNLHRQLGGHVQYCGIDISKPAIKIAASKLPKAAFAVASSFDIPLPDHCIDMALSVFAPFDPNEIKRILKPAGQLIRVSPGPNHFLQLKQHLYLNATPHTPPKPIIHAKVIREETIQKNTTLSSQDLENLINMTPLKWYGNQDTKETLLQSKSFNIDFEFIIQELTFS